MPCNRLKIVHVITNLWLGGAEMMLYKLLSRMDDQRFENVVVSLIGLGPVGRQIEQLGIQTYSLGMPRGRPSVRGMRALVRVLQRERPQILQTWMPHANLVGQLSGMFCRVPHIVWNVRSSNEDAQHTSRMTFWTIGACKMLSPRPDAIVINSEGGLAYYNSIGFHPRRWAMIPNGFDLDRFKPDPQARESVRAELGLSPDTFLIGLLGRYHPMKDHRTFLRAAGMLRESHPDSHFLVAGTDAVASEPELSAMLTEFGLGKSVHLLGERKDTPRLMAALDILTSSSAYNEGFSNSIGEAMACGVPCVVTDVGDSAIIVGATGIVVPPRDARAITDAWKRLLDAEPAERRARGEAARRRIEQKYSLEHIVRTYEELYLSLSKN